MLTIILFCVVQVRKTQNAIKHALTERFYAWEDAVQLAKEDPEIEFTKDGGVTYTPMEEPLEAEPEYMGEEDMLVESDEAGQVRADDKVKHEVVDPSIPQDSGKTQQDGARPS